MAQGQPIVRAVLFYSPTCPHCQQVITQDLLPLLEEYGSQLEIAGFDISQAGGHALYQAAVERFAIAEHRLGVPTLIIADVVLVGSLEIPEDLPGIIEAGLAEGGVDWPDIPGLREALQLEIRPTQTATGQPLITPSPPATEPAFVALDTPPAKMNSGLDLVDNQNSSLQERFRRDPMGNTLSVSILFGMIAAVFWTVMQFRQTNGGHNRQWFGSIPLLCLVGIAIAVYLSYVEVAQVAAICGPVGDCNTVQQSVYARLFGILPIGLLGLFGYAAILLAWWMARHAEGRIAGAAKLGLFGAATGGTLFSIYLTFLEPFVIGATCIWCLSSAVLMTLLMLASLDPAMGALIQTKEKRWR